MKIASTSFILIMSFWGFSQHEYPIQNQRFKQEIITSKEVNDWQKAMIAFQKSNMEFCNLIYEQQLNERIAIACKTTLKEISEHTISKLFRSMRITKELRDSVTFKEKLMRDTYPQISTHFNSDAMFKDIYAPILKSREQGFR